MPDLLEEFEAKAPLTNLDPHQAWRRLLQSDETILWEGLADHDELVKKRRMTLMSCAAISAALAGLLLFVDAEPSTVGVWMLVKAFGLIAVCIAAVLGKLALDAHKADISMAYAITNLAAIIHERRQHPKVLKYPLNKVRNIHVVEGPPDTVHFARRIHGRLDAGKLVPIPFDEAYRELKNDDKFRPIAFENIENGQSVAAILSNARDASL